MGHLGYLASRCSVLVQGSLQEFRAFDGKGQKNWHSESLGSVDKFEPSLSFQNKKSCKLPYHCIGVMNLNKLLKMMHNGDLKHQPQIHKTVLWTKELDHYTMVNMLSVNMQLAFICIAINRLRNCIVLHSAILNIHV